MLSINSATHHCRCHTALSCCRDTSHRQLLSSSAECDTGVDRQCVCGCCWVHGQ